MLFPDSERVIYGRNPLVEVICQIRFPTILRISEGNLSDFQDKIRIEYPLYGIQPPEINNADAPPELASLMQRLNILGASRPNV
ncbi:MAG: TIGR04255 family protein, partial [Chloroflexi bacterium]|nr:TIGR04255 family protein [Chloroflexota bacterium]